MYERCLKQYVSSLKPFQLALVESAQLRSQHHQSAADVVSVELKDLNRRYIELLGRLHHRLVTLKQVHETAGLYFPVMESLIISTFSLRVCQRCSY